MPPVAGMVTWVSFSPAPGNLRVTFLGLLPPNGWHSTCVEDNCTAGCTVSFRCFTCEGSNASKIQEAQCCMERSQTTDTLRSHRASLKTGHKLATKSCISLSPLDTLSKGCNQRDSHLLRYLCHCLEVEQGARFYLKTVHWTSSVATLRITGKQKRRPVPSPTGPGRICRSGLTALCKW